jgi:uncharacterized membrane protein YhhN
MVHCCCAAMMPDSFLWALLAVWGVVLVSSFAFGQFNADRTRHSIRPLLMLTSALLVVMATLFWLRRAVHTPLAGFSLLVALGMAASFVGDLIMAEYIRTPERVLFGMLAFGAAHVLYIAAYLNAERALRLESGWAGWGAVIAFLWIGLGAWVVFVRSPHLPPLFSYAAPGYVILLSAMTGLAAALALAAPRLGTLPLGAVLFLVSDTILANQIFRKRNWFLVSDVVWVLYICGQALIVWSNVPALEMLG